MAKTKSKVSEMVTQLRAAGHKVVVKVVVEKETGYRRRIISSIDGKKFVGREGNKQAREMTNNQVSVETSRRKSASGKRGGVASGKSRRTGKVGSLTPKERRRINAVNRALRKARKSYRVSLEQARLRKEREGRDALYDALSNTERHSRGWAYAANVEAFIERLETTYNRADEFYNFTKTLWWLRRNKKNLYDEALQKARDKHYEWINLELTGSACDEMMALIVKNGRINKGKAEYTHDEDEYQAYQEKVSEAARRGWEKRRERDKQFVETTKVEYDENGKLHFTLK